MSVFNYIDSFFFISLGITFVLILLLVFHFKQRITSLEQKSDTMFEILNTMVKEIAMTKTMIMNQFSNNYSLLHNNENLMVQPENYKHKNDIEEESEDDDCEDDDYEDDDSEEDYESEENRSAVKVVKIDLGNITELPDENNDIDTESDYENQDVPTLNENVEQIVVEKLDNDSESNVVENLDNEDISVEKSLETDNNSKTDNNYKQDMYRSMTSSELKHIVFTKGLATSVGKLKKHELLKLLESEE